MDVSGVACSLPRSASARCHDHVVRPAGVPADAIPPPRWQGFCGKLSDRLDALIAAKRIWNVRGVLIVRDGKLVLER